MRCALAEWPNRVAESVVGATRRLRAGQPTGDGLTGRARRLLVLGEPLGERVDSETDQPEGRVLLRLPELLRALELPAGQTEVRVRRHPSEIAGKYEDVAAQWDLRSSVVGAKDRPLALDLAWADIVLGFTSYALYLASVCGLRCYSLAAMAGEPPSLPTVVVPELTVAD